MILFAFFANAFHVWDGDCSFVRNRLQDRMHVEFLTPRAKRGQKAKKKKKRLEQNKKHEIRRQSSNNQ